MIIFSQSSIDCDSGSFIYKEHMISESQIIIFAVCLLFREYLDNIGLVDTGVSELVSIVEDFFGYDGRTAYVFTSDHGMTNWGKNLVYMCICTV